MVAVGDGGAMMMGRRWIPVVRIGLGLLVGVSFGVIVVKNIDFRKTGAILEHASVGPILLALSAFAADFLLRALRFCGLLSAATGHRVPYARCVAPFVASFGMSDLLPLRAGDGLRVVWFSRRFDISAGTVLGAMLVERVLDLMTLLLLGAVALPLVGASVPVALVASFQLVLVGSLAAGLLVLVAPSLLARLLDRLSNGMPGPTMAMLHRMLHSISDALRKIGSWRRIVMFGGLSIACWLIESMVFLEAWLSLGGSGGAGIPFLSFIASTLGTLIPSLPGHFGSYEYFGVQAFTLSGTDPSFAAAVVFLAHLILWAPTALFAIVWLPFGSMRAPGSAGKVAAQL